MKTPRRPCVRWSTALTTEPQLSVDGPVVGLLFLCCIVLMLKERAVRALEGIFIRSTGFRPVFYSQGKNQGVGSKPVRSDTYSRRALKDRTEQKSAVISP